MSYEDAEHGTPNTGRCTLCPRRCGALRAAAQGFCGAPEDLEVATVCVHRGEEPPLNPIVNVFFAHCNLQCIYCQNWQISGREGSPLQVTVMLSRLSRKLKLMPMLLHS